MTKSLVCSTVKPPRNEFRAFWLNWNKPLKHEWIQLIRHKGWEDLMDWSTDGPVTGNVSHEENFSLIVQTPSPFYTDPLPPLEEEFRSTLMGIQVCSVTPGHMVIEFPYELDTDLQTLLKNIRAYGRVKDAFGLKDTKENSSNDTRLPDTSDGQIMQGHTEARKATPTAAQGVTEPESPTSASSSTAVNSGTRPSADQPQAPREASPDIDTRINAALASLGRQMNQLKRKHSADMASVRKKHNDGMAALGKQIEELRAENERLRSRERVDKGPAKEQLKDTVEAILEQEKEGGMGGSGEEP